MTGRARGRVTAARPIHRKWLAAKRIASPAIPPNQ